MSSKCHCHGTASKRRMQRNAEAHSKRPNNVKHTLPEIPIEINFVQLKEKIHCSAAGSGNWFSSREDS